MNDLFEKCRLCEKEGTIGCPRCNTGYTGNKLHGLKCFQPKDKAMTDKQELKLRVKKNCGKCRHWQGFPYVHCDLGCEIGIRTLNASTFTTYPQNPEKCKQARQERIKHYANQK